MEDVWSIGPALFVRGGEVNRRLGGGLEELWRRFGGLEVWRMFWRRFGGGLKEVWRRFGGGRRERGVPRVLCGILVRDMATFGTAVLKLALVKQLLSFSQHIHHRPFWPEEAVVVAPAWLLNVQDVSRQYVADPVLVSCTKALVTVLGK